MRARLALAVLAAGLFAGSACAADLPAAWRYASYGHRAGQIWIVDVEPGVTARAYWLAPWRHRHYFPATGKRPKVGRREYFSVARVRPRPAETFERHWSTLSLSPPPRVRVIEAAPEPPGERLPPVPPPPSSLK